MRQCPIHEQTLLDYCPDCKESLPSLSVLPHRKCATCAYGAYYKGRISAPQFRHLKVIAEMATVQDRPWQIIDKHYSVSHWRQCNVVEAPPRCFVSLALFMWLDLVCAADDTYTHRLDLS